MFSKKARRFSYLGTAAVCAAVAAISARAADEDGYFPSINFDHPAIQYQTRPVNDVVSRLQKQLDSGEVKLDYDPAYGYLPSLLEHLGVIPDSQMLVFSKTSFQGAQISPKSPRALYFNDEVAVGLVPRGPVLEMAAVDPKQGVIFYTLDRQQTAKPRFVRPNMECIQCHMLPGTLNVSGLMIESVIPGPDGTPLSFASTMMVDNRTPLNERWGGWYVTGTAGTLQHRGNTVSHYGVLDTGKGQNLTSLADRLDVTQYPESTSDIVALMTIEHQTRMTNLLIRLGWEARIATQEGKLEEFREHRLSRVVDNVVDFMLFADEAKIHDPIAGVSTFTKTFAERGPRDPKGRSLRDFDLQKRLFRYPLSYMIYSAVFDALPDLAKDAIYRRLYDVLSEKDTGESFAYLSPQDRRALLEIVRDTKPNLPAYWK